jgi:ribonuclease Z
MDLVVTFLGTAASAPSASRGVAATLLARGAQRWLVDCGEGTQRQFLRSGLGLVDLDAIFLTHLHGDHYLGLPGLLKTYVLRGRERPLPLTGPPGLLALLELLRPVIGRVPFGVEVVEAEPWETVWAGENARIESFPTDHGVPSLGYALLEDDRPGAFDVAAARALGVPEGPAFGVLQRGGEVETPAGTVRPEQVMGPPRSGRRVVVSGDTRPCLATVGAAQGASLLVHEATLLDEDRERALETRHTTALEAGALAREAGVRLLALTHLSSRFPPREARREAEREFDRVIVPRDFDQVEIPFPERGDPEHRRAERRAERVPQATPSGEPASVPDDL